MEAAELYFMAMVLIMLPLVVVHLTCWQIVKRVPATMPDKKARDWYMRSEVVMATACLCMLWYMWMMLPWMISICATDPWVGIVSHVPWIALTGCVLFAKVRHLWRLIAQVQAQ